MYSRSFIKMKLIIFYLFIFLNLYSLCYAQLEEFNDPQRLFTASLGGYLFSRKLQGQDEEENINQLVLPVYAEGFLIKNLNIMIHQSISYSKLNDAELSGLENTLFRFSYNFFDDALIPYLTFRIPIVKVKPEIETARLDSLMYNEVLHLDVKRLTQGFDVDAGFGFTHSIGDLAFGFGAGYIIRGSYDRLSQDGNTASYNPGNSFSGTAGFRLPMGILSFGGGAIYLYSGDDTIDDAEVFKNGSEVSLYG
ncbi:hypothetical protein GF312_15705, partial [Candidatus Poribacteria bacterium]|nr:hypothetical protein [Candidatus Poribacteria bacterium]